MPFSPAQAIVACLSAFATPRPRQGRRTAVRLCSARGRGVAYAVKQHQAAAARAAGWRRLRTQNDLANVPMLRVNEKLGYRPKFEWVHLTGPLIG